MRTNRMAFVMAALMVAAGIGAVVARPETKVTNPGPAFKLEEMVPRQFGDWREDSQRVVQVVNPQVQKTLDEAYSQILTRTYVNADGYRIMLSVAYGTDQRGHMRTHDPESCYPAQGFMLHRREASPLVTPYGEIPVTRLFASRGSRMEPVTYWIKVGDRAVKGWQTRLVELGYTLTGRIPDGLLFRVSSIDPDQARASQLQDLFITQLLQAVSPAERKHLSALGEP